jgi:competence protein ComEC
MTPSKILLYFCLSFIFGIFISSLLGFLPRSSIYFLLPGLILGIFLILISWRYEKLMVLGFCILFLVLGIWQYQKALIKIVNSPIKNFIGEEITILGLIDKEPDITEKITQLEVKIEKIKKINNPEENSSSELGKVLVTIRKYPEYKYGDRLKISGTLKNPDVLDNFNYRDYLAKDGILAVMDFPEIEIIDRNLGNPLIRILFSFKDKLKESLNRALSRPHSGILEALLFGEEENISKEFKEKLNLTGTRHIAAVSGMNITIISAILFNFLLWLGLWRSQAFYLSITLIIFYILMIGAPASGVRAGIMAILFLTAQHFGRLSSASRLVVLAATVMLAFNPLLLRLDVGFQLSFLAVMGLIYLQPIFSDLFKKIPSNFQLRNSLASTLSAQIFVFPILVYNFGQISLISPLANILILPFIPFITILGFLFSFVGIFSQSLGQILSWPAYLIINYIIKVINFFSKISWAPLVFKNVNWIFLIISYFLIWIIVWCLQEKQKLKFLRY